MFAHVLEAARDCSLIDQIAVVTPEPQLVPADVVTLPDAGRGLNDALRQSLHALWNCGAERTAILLADLPFLTSGEISTLITASGPTGLALAPDRHGQGTNAVCLAGSIDLEMQFGPDSFARHLASANSLAVDAAVVRLPGLSYDVDEPADLVQLRQMRSVRSQRQQVAR